MCNSKYKKKHAEKLSALFKFEKKYMGNYCKMQFI